MPSALDALAASFHRSVLGGLLALVALVALGWSMRRLNAGDIVVAAAGGLVAAGAVSWILSLFLEGLRER
ncbi:MAG: hypothetical protein ABEJ90_02395 [Halobacterium sp.]